MFDVEEEVALLEDHEDQQAGEIGTVVVALVAPSSHTQGNTYRVEFVTTDKYRPRTAIWVPEDKLERA